MDQHQQQLQLLHATAEENLERKLRKVCKKHGVIIMCPTISDFYHEREIKTHIRGVPSIYQLDFFFKHYNSFAAYNFKALKDGQPFEITSAIWHYRLDNYHNFSRYHDVTRVNVILATIIHVSAERDRICNPETTEFREAFLTAWLFAEIRDPDTRPQESFLRLWADTDFDLVRFNTNQMKRVQVALNKLKEGVPPMPANMLPEEFLEIAESIEEEELRNNGPAWALQWVLHTESSSLLFDDDYKEEVLDDIMDMMGVEEEVTQLSAELFEKPVVAGILVPINENVIVNAQQPVPGRYQYWISSADAVALLERCAAEMVGMRAMTDMFAGLNFMTG